jgi:glycosyltransferase involved in cell wall biosynthesis
MTQYQSVTFIIPCRNNLIYLKQAVDSIEKHYGSYHKIVVLDDASTDETWEWVNSLNKPNIKTYRNEGPDRVGHTVLYDIGISLAETPIVTILHSDMVVTKNYVSNMLKNLKPLSVVSATRIEPPLHPPGPEKYVKNFGMEPEEFIEQTNEFEKFVAIKEAENKNIVTNGIFAPWMLYKEDFVCIGGHDKLFAPMELEDSDIFNRFHLQQYELIQSRDAFVYHMTCRGSRFKDGIKIERIIDLPDGTKWYKPEDSAEYTLLRNNKFKEWWRKWHTDVLHNELMMPIVGNRYDTTFVVHNCNLQILAALEPWCDRIYTDCDYKEFAERAQTDSMFDLRDKFYSIGDEMKGDVHILFDGAKLTNNHFTTFIKNIPFIIQQTDSIGSFEWDMFQLHIFSLKTKDMVTPFFKNIF